MENKKNNLSKVCLSNLDLCYNNIKTRYMD